MNSGVFYVVATPIGNLADISLRALQILKEVDLILAEDTRHSRPLLNHYGITTQLKACHEHNESRLSDWVVEQIQAGQSLALISDAGTPLISDPGFVLVRALREADLRIEVVPGASSVIAALSVAGLATDRFLFDGFLPAKQAARCESLKHYQGEQRTVVLLESSHRILACLNDIHKILGDQRQIVVARELTKKFETVKSGTASELVQELEEDSNQQRGEFVVLIAGVTALDGRDDTLQELRRVLTVLLDDLPVKQAAAIAAKLCNVGKNDAYKLALELKQ